MIGVYVEEENDGIEDEKCEERVGENGDGKSVEMGKWLEENGEERGMIKNQESGEKLKKVENVFKRTVSVKASHGIEDEKKMVWTRLYIFRGEYSETLIWKFMIIAFINRNLWCSSFLV